RELLVLDLHVESLSDLLDRSYEVDLFDLLYERDRVAALAAPEAFEGAACRGDGEARRLLLMERAQALVRAAGLAQADVILDERQNLCGRPHGFDGGVFEPRHQYASANRSVMPAR